LGGILFLLVVSFLSRGFFSGGGQPTAPAAGDQYSGSADRDASEEQLVKFVSFVLDDAQHTWEQKIQGYRHAKLVLFRDYTQSACGGAQSATGPFYCPEDEKVYLDLNFFAELNRRFGAPGDFAQAYVITHEIGHHVQKLLGIEQKVRRLQQAEPSERNPLSVRLELQADCLAGVWGNSTKQRNIIDQADIAEGLRAAAAIGDDRLQRLGRGHVTPESFTHGSSEQRMTWLKKGLDSGQVSACNTFENANTQ
jgi:predicted metalloprotease